jgi:hypothetical protein|nr:MAG TPA: hypothetical protein [Crassvirales sp.]
MKAIGIKMVDLVPMTAREANDKGHRIGEHSFETEGYEVTYGDGYKSWCPKEVADAAYFRLSPENDGTKVLKEDVENFVTNVEVMTVGEKTTVVNAHTLTGFDMVRRSSCVDPKNYNEELGKQYALEVVTDDLWGHLGFVLQWAKFGLKQKLAIAKYPAHVERMIAEHDELRERSIKLANFINGNEIFKTLSENEQNDMKDQLMYMQKYIDCLRSRLIRSGVDASNI